MKNFDYNNNSLKVFLLGPCHQAYMLGCGITSLQTYQTPLGDISINQTIVSEL